MPNGGGCLNRNKMNTTKSNLRTFGACYKHPDGNEYEFHFLANDYDDARIRLRSIRGNAEMLGELMGEVSCGIPGSELWVKSICWINNLKRPIRRMICCKGIGEIAVEDDPWRPIASAPQEHGVELLLDDPEEGPLIGYWTANGERWQTSEKGKRIAPSHWQPLTRPQNV